MSEHKVTLRSDEGTFRGLSNSNLLFHQCIAELVDNAIAAKKEKEKFHVSIIFVATKDVTKVDLYVADNSKGMGLEMLKNALQLGQSATETSRLNEHGFGLKNSLATLSGGNGEWTIWTQAEGQETVLMVRGPFKAEMTIRDDEAFPSEDFLPADMSTLVKVSVARSFVRTVQGKGGPSIDIARLRPWLVEHLGVMYRGYLEQDSKNYESTGVITVAIDNNTERVPPVFVPLGNKKIEYIAVELAGKLYQLEYHYGTLDEVKRDILVKEKPARYYYQQNVPTQGIDIRLGKRTIATGQFSTIWKQVANDKDKPLAAHPSYNDFVGELLIPDLPRGVLRTTNNKTDFSISDPDWQNIFDKLNEIRPQDHVRDKSEKSLKNKWMAMLKATNPDDWVSDEKSVWPTATRIDVYRKTADGKVVIYEIKVGSGTSLHLYQLKMYWDGLVLTKELPTEAFLLVEDFHTTLEEMANTMNSLTPPEDSKPYNFKVEKHKDKGLQ